MSNESSTAIQNINETNQNEGEREVIFPNRDELDHVISSSLHGNLHTLGKLWIYTLRAFLTGVKFSPVTTVHAAPPKTEFPKELKASDLPMYGCDHLKSKEFDSSNCNEKLIHNAIKPQVIKMRKSIQNVLVAGKKEISDTYDEITTDLSNVGERIKKYCRDDKNLNISRGIVASGGLFGYYMASKGCIPKRVFFTACGLAATGMLCFPTETDDKIRLVSYHIGKGLIAVYNYMGDRNLELRENLPCPKPKPPDEKFVIKCEEKKK